MRYGLKSDANILDLLFERSEQAIEALKWKYDRACRAIARGVLNSEQDVEECVADTFLAVWNRILPEKPEHLGAYVTRIARNQALTRLSHNTAGIRDTRLKVCLDELKEILPGGIDPEKLLQSRVITDTINQYLTTQNKTNRQIFVRRYYLHQSCKEIGAYFGMTEQAVRSRLFRMRDGLKEALKKEGIFV